MKIKLHIACGVLALLAASCAQPKVEVAEEILPEPEPERLFGLVVDSFIVEKTTVQKGQMIAQILTNAGIPYSKAIEAYDRSMPTFDFRRMKAGNTCYFFHDFAHLSTDSVGPGDVRHFVYEVSPTAYVRCTFGTDSVTVAMEEQEVTTKRKEAYARIESSLWNALREQDLDPQLALDLSDVFAWTVDFFGIGAGDEFGIVYDEKYVGDKRVGLGSIWGAIYVPSSGKKQYAFRNEGDSTAGYYDLQGNSLRREFLKAPLRYSRISSRFSNGRLHPVLKIRRPHHGVDYAAPTGTPVVAIGDGKVIKKGYDKKGGGNYIVIRHNSVYTSEYMHLSAFAKGLVVGMQVAQGQHIGNVGATGLATGPHLDFRMFRDGHAIDPLKVEMPPAEPISNDDITDFLERSDKMKAVVDSVMQAERARLTSGEKQ